MRMNADTNTISVIIITLNSAPYIEECLHSVYRQDQRGLEVIVVDNGSADRTCGIIEEKYPRVILIRNDRNEGACRARNQGIERSRGGWILTLDSDAVLGDGCISAFRKAAGLVRHPTGMIQPALLRKDGRTVYSMGVLLTSTRRFYDVNNGRPADLHGGAPDRIIGPCSACAFYRRDMLELLREDSGYFDDRFFFLAEDVDLAWRAKRSGWKVAFCPEIVCFHDGNGSLTDLKRRQYLCFRNRYLMIEKNERFPARLLVYGLSAPFEVCRALYIALTNKYFWTDISSMFMPRTVPR